jgi:hypothetical protein
VRPEIGAERPGESNIPVCRDVIREFGRDDFGWRDTLIYPAIDSGDDIGFRILRDFEAPGDADVIEKVRTDLDKGRCLVGSPLLHDAEAANPGSEPSAATAMPPPRSTSATWLMRSAPWRTIRPARGEWHPRVPEHLDGRELADWRAGRDARSIGPAMTVGKRREDTVADG